MGWTLWVGCPLPDFSGQPPGWSTFTPAVERVDTNGTSYHWQFYQGDHRIGLWQYDPQRSRHWNPAGNWLVAARDWPRAVGHETFDEALAHVHEWLRAAQVATALGCGGVFQRAVLPEGPVEGNAEAAGGKLWGTGGGDEVVKRRGGG